MKTAPYVFAILFIGTFVYLALNQFELPTFFFFDETNKIKGHVIETKRINGIRGRYYQLVTYEYMAGDSIYRDQFKAGKLEGLRLVGDTIFIEFSVDDPGKNKVVGFQKRKSEPIKVFKLESQKKKEEN